MQGSKQLTTRQAKKVIDSAMASGKMSEDVHKQLSDYFDKKLQCDLTFFSEYTNGNEDFSKETEYVAAHYIATQYFKVPPDAEDPFVKYGHLNVDVREFREGRSGVEPIGNFLPTADYTAGGDLKWPMVVKFLKAEDVPAGVREQAQKENGKRKKF